MIFFNLIIYKVVALFSSLNNSLIAPKKSKNTNALCALLFLVSPVILNAQAGCSTFSCVAKTTADGLSNDWTWGIYESNGIIYVATEDSLSISTDGGNTFTNKATKTNTGLGADVLLDVFESGDTIFAATDGGGLAK